MKLKRYVVVTRVGTIKRATLIKQYKRACHWANGDGDSVVEVEIDLSKEPLFIRKKQL